VRVSLSPVESEDALPRFCGTCGRELQRYLDPRYDRFTGKQSGSVLSAQCPRFDTRSLDHDGFVVSPRPEPPAAPDFGLQRR
jgi:hypothetical protein